MASLRRVIRDWLHKVGWRRTEGNAVSRSLAHDLGAPPEVVNRVLEQTTAELRELAAIDEASDARPIIHKALDELAKYGHQSRPREEALMERWLEEMPERDLIILRHFKQGMKHKEIAALLDADVATVRRSLVKTYADLRMKMMSQEAAGLDALATDAESERARKFGPH